MLKTKLNCVYGAFTAIFLVVIVRMPSETLPIDHNKLSNNNDRLFDGVIILGKARTGSTLIASLLNTWDTIYNHEPIHSIVYNESAAMIRHDKIISDSLKCHLHSAIMKKLLMVSPLYEDTCSPPFRGEFCNYRIKTTEYLCATRFNVIKTILLNVEDAVSAIETAKTKTAVLLLVRDPRAVMASRNEYKSFSPTLLPIAVNHSTYCEKLRNELSFLRRNVNFKNRYMIVKYEDLVQSPRQVTMKIYKFLGRKYTKYVDYYVMMRLIRKPKKSLDVNLLSLERDSKTRLTAWRETLPYENVIQIQKDCSDIMERMNYKKIERISELKDFSFNLY